MAKAMRKAAILALMVTKGNGGPALSGQNGNLPSIRIYPAGYFPATGRIPESLRGHVFTEGRVKEVDYSNDCVLEHQYFLALQK